MVLGDPTIRFAECESTHKYMHANFENLQAGTVVIADYQSGGTGRHNRSWIAPKGKNLSFNILLPTDNLQAKFYAPVTQVAAITLAQILRKNGINATVKWPNDILVEKKKICGIISELLGVGRKAISLGIGLNVNTPAEDLLGIDRPVTSMFIESSVEWNRDELLAEFLTDFAKNFERLVRDGLSPFIEEWSRMGNFVGVKARLVEGSLSLEGVIESVQIDGSLLFKTADGLKNIWSGDLLL
ncbi:bifunctional ligase/repressor BirA [Fibrobacterales bacterium]|nr:bifunctional ligase/repressor BirA [Fibrobacterales bacterium]